MEKVNPSEDSLIRWRNPSLLRKKPKLQIKRAVYRSSSIWIVSNTIKVVLGGSVFSKSSFFYLDNINRVSQTQTKRFGLETLFPVSRTTSRP